MKKKLLSVLLCAAMTAGMLAGCGNNNDSGSSGNQGEQSTPNSAQDGGNNGNSQGNQADDVPEESALPPMNTTDKITLTYMNYDDQAVTDYLAREFEKLYPNITVNIIYEYGPYREMLMDLINTGQTPDCFMIAAGADFALENQLLYDMTELWNNDPENQNLLPSINGARIGYYGTDQKLATPIKFFPDMVFTDMGVFERLNLPMPRTDWTWDEMIQAIKDTTNSEFGTYGFNMYHSILSMYPTAADPNCVGEFGFYGDHFDLSNWAVAMMQLKELREGKYLAPQTAEEQAAWLGGTAEWPPATGKLAFQFDAFWTYLNIFDRNIPSSEEGKEYWVVERGIEMVPYALPSVKGNENGYKLGVCDMGGISAGTPYPREAYELLKFMGWGVDGWKAKLALYKTDDENGTPFYRHNMPCPITMDEEIWKDFQTSFFPSTLKPESEQTDADKRYGKYWDDYFVEIKKGAIPFGYMTIPGFETFMNTAYNGVESSIYNGEKTAQDWVEELNKAATESFLQTLERAGLEPATKK